MATRTITVHDRCTVDGCGRVLMSIAEGERGTCGSCWVSTWSNEKKASMARLIATGFDPHATDDQKDKAVTEALKHHRNG